jgi:hypothetical protein
MLTNTIFIILFCHWFADFFLQTSWQAENKSKRVDALTFHVLSYSVVTSLIWWLAFGLTFAPNVLFVFCKCYF